MSGYGKIILISMLLLPAISTLTGVVMFNPHIDIMVTIFGMNLIPMLAGGGVSVYLLRRARKSGGVGRSITLWPTVFPSIFGSAWYLRDALFPAAQDPGRVYLAGPVYLLVVAIVIGLFACTACSLVRSRRAAS